MAYKIIPDSVRECFSYDPETGVISRVKPVSGGKVGPVGRVDASGYLRMTHECRTLLVHRVAWFLAHDEQPKEIDHINRDRSDNRLCNLRSVDRSANQINNDAKGICWSAAEQRWSVRFQGKQRYHGRNIMLAHFHRHMAVIGTHPVPLPPPAE